MSSPARMPDLGLHPSRAVIDIGSNTVRLVIYGGPERAPIVVHNEKVTAKLGRSLAETGRLSGKGVNAALAALARFRMLLDLEQVDSLDIVATAAARDASDGPQFLQQVAALGFQPRLLSGEEEAETSALGVIAAFPGAQGIVADLGGGSLELIDIDGEDSRHGVSLPMGTLRLPQLREKGPRGFSRFVASQLDATDWEAEPDATLYLVGGSFRSLGKLALSQSGLTIDDPHGHSQDRDAAVAFARRIARLPAEELGPGTGIAASRLASMPHTAALLDALLARLQPKRIVYSAWGLREGMLYRSLEPGVRAQDPLLAGVSAFAQRQGVSLKDAARVAAWTTLDGAEADRLHVAATLLALAAAYLEPNLRASHGVEWAMRKRWLGVERRDQALLGATVLASCGRLALPPDIGLLADAKDLHEAQARGLAIRLCRRFSSFAKRSLSDCSLTIEQGHLTMSMAPPLGVLVNEGVLRDLKILASHLGVEPAWNVAEGLPRRAASSN